MNVQLLNKGGNNVSAQNKSKMNGIVAYLLLAAGLVALPFVFTALNFNYGVLVLCFAALYIIAVSGLDIVFGYSGQISMGHAAFFAIGAYGSVMMYKYLTIPIPIAMILAAVVSTVIGALLAYPASKLVFHFLSLATIAFGEIVYQLVASSPGNVTGNFTGFFTSTIDILGYKLNTYTKYYLFSLVAVTIFLIIKTNVVRSKVGRAFLAIRENSHAADGMGVNVRKYKIVAFSISAFFTAYAGAMYAHLTRFISPDTFTNRQSVMFLTMLLFGGSASLLGPVTGVVTVLLLNEALRSAQKYQMFIYGILLLAVILLMPGGIYGMIRDTIRSRRKGSDKSGQEGKAQHANS